LSLNTSTVQYSTMSCGGGGGGGAVQHVDILIVGGGLSGMTLAYELEKNKNKQTSNSSSSIKEEQQQQKNKNKPSYYYKVLEAKSVLGGRLLNDATHDEIDLGGAWIWPQHQPLMRNLVTTTALRISTIEQEPIHCNETSGSGTRRIKGGAVQIVRKLAEKVPQENIQLESPVKSCTLDVTTNQIRVETTTTRTATTTTNTTTTSDAAVTYLANKVVFCVPPRLLADDQQQQQHVIFDPPLSAPKQRALQTSNTWMAGVTKVALVYPCRFWETDYSSFARIGAVQGGGPVFQMYDASTDHLNVLTAFTVAGTTATTTTGTTTSEDNVDADNKTLAEQVARQMGSLWKALGKTEFLDKVDSYTSYHVQRWPLETYMSENRNPTMIQPHPEPVEALSTPEWDDTRLFFAGTETDQVSPGVM
jgi:monoamine oxidase